MSDLPRRMKEAVAIQDMGIQNIISSLGEPGDSADGDSDGGKKKVSGFYKSIALC